MNEQEIRSITNPRFFQRGEALQRRRAVYDMDVQEFGTQTSIFAKVLGSSGTEYQVDMSVEDGEITGYWCSCPAAEEYDDMCKHAVAVALEYRKRQQKAALLSLQQKTQSATSPILKSMLYQCSMDRQARFMQRDITGKVEIEPILRKKTRFWELEFKLGSQRKYVMKDIFAFAEALEKREKVQYGKQLSFIHEESAFTPKSAELAAFIAACIQERWEAAMRERSYYYYSSTNLKGRTLALSQEEAVQFLELVFEQNLSCTLQSEDGKELGLLEIRKENPSLPVELIYLTEQDLKKRQTGSRRDLYHR